MVIAVTNAVALHINEESTWGEAPTSADMLQLRFTGESLTFGKQTVQSETIRADRMRDQMALVGFETGGDFNFELSFFSYDQLIEGVMFGTWEGATSTTASTLAFTATGVTDSANGLAKYPVGAYIWVSGATAKSLNRRYRVTVSTAGELTLSPAPATTEAAGASIKISSSAVQVTTSTGVIDAAFVASTKKLTFSGSTGFNPSTGTAFVAGQFVSLSGFAQAANNGLKRIAAIDSTSITFVEACADETVADATALKLVGRRIRNGVTQRSYHIQKGFTDINQYMSFRGMRVGTMSIEATAAQIITGSFSFMGKTTVRGDVSFASTSEPTSTTSVMTGSAHIGTIFQDGAAIAAGIRSVTLKVENNLRNSIQIGSLYPYAVGYGFQDVTGDIELYFEDETIYDQLVNHTETELSFPVTDDKGHVYVFTIPSVLFTEGYPVAGGGNDDSMLPLSYGAIRNATYDCQIQIDAIPSLTN